MCAAQPGEPCVDLRTKTPRVRVTLHAEREALIRELDRRYSPA